MLLLVLVAAIIEVVTGSLFFNDGYLLLLMLGVASGYLILLQILEYQSSSFGRLRSNWNLELNQVKFKIRGGLLGILEVPSDGSLLTGSCGWLLLKL